MKKLLFAILALFALTTNAQITSKQGDSFTALVVFDSTYTLHIKDISVYLGQREVAKKSTGGIIATNKPWAFRVPISSATTRQFARKTAFQIAIWDSLLGVKRSGPIFVDFTPNDNAYSNSSTNTGVDATIYVSVQSGGQVSNIHLATILKGDKGDAGTSIDTTLYLRKTTATATYVAKTSVGTAASLDVSVSGNASTSQVVKGNDTRLSDSRTPTAHTHPQSEVTGLVATLAAKSDTLHTHTTAKITDWTAAWAARFAAQTTSGLAEGSNLYHTTARVQSLGDARYGQLSAANNWSANNTFGGISCNSISSTTSYITNTATGNILNQTTFGLNFKTYSNSIIGKIFDNGNWFIGSNPVDAGYKLDVVGTARATKYQLSALNTAPSSATDTGVTGEIRVTATYIYVCTATNTWVRASLSTW